MPACISTFIMAINEDDDQFDQLDHLFLWFWDFCSDHHHSDNRCVTWQSSVLIDDDHDEVVYEEDYYYK